MAAPVGELLDNPLRFFNIALVLAIRADHAANIPSGTFDMSSQDSVQPGRYMYPPGEVVPFVGVAFPVVSSSNDGPPMGCFNRTATWDIMGFVNALRSDALNDDLSFRGQEVQRLMYDISAAIESSAYDVAPPPIFAIRDHPAFRTIKTEFVQLDGDEAGLSPEMGMFFGTVTIEFTNRRGV